jgi:hypothetical protein
MSEPVHTILIRATRQATPVIVRATRANAPATVVINRGPPGPEGPIGPPGATYWEEIIGRPEVVPLTAAAYTELVASGTVDPNTLYIVTE